MLMVNDLISQLKFSEAIDQSRWCSVLCAVRFHVNKLCSAFRNTNVTSCYLFIHQICDESGDTNNEPAVNECELMTIDGARLEIMFYRDL